MKTLIVLTGVLFLFVFIAGAQTRVDNTINKTNQSINSANNTANTALTTVTSTTGQAKDLANKIGSLFPKKNNGAASTTNTTQINIKGVNFAKLNRLNGNILDCTGVKDSKMKFNTEESIITVTHLGSTAKLLKLIEEKSQDIFTDDNINSFDEGNISITLK